MGGCGVVSSGSGYMPVTGSCESGNELSSPVEFVIFLEELRNYQLLKKDSTPWG
jgi:hypothetical protein